MCSGSHASLSKRNPEFCFQTLICFSPPPFSENVPKLSGSSSAELQGEKKTKYILIFAECVFWFIPSWCQMGEIWRWGRATELPWKTESAGCSLAHTHTLTTSLSPQTTGIGKRLIWCELRYYKHHLHPRHVYREAAAENSVYTFAPHRLPKHQLSKQLENPICLSDVISEAVRVRWNSPH